MRIRTLLALVFCILISVFIILNWGELSRETAINLGFTSIMGPLGLVMFGMLLVAFVVFAGYALALQTSSLLEARNHTKELKSQRELADKAEMSRFTELRTVIDRIESNSHTRTTESNQLIQNQIQALQKELLNSIEQGYNTLAAHIGEMEDRMERSGNLPHTS